MTLSLPVMQSVMQSVHNTQTKVAIGFEAFVMQFLPFRLTSGLELETTLGREA